MPSCVQDNLALLHFSYNMHYALTKCLPQLYIVRYSISNKGKFLLSLWEHRSITEINKHYTNVTIYNKAPRNIYTKNHYYYNARYIQKYKVLIG